MGDGQHVWAAAEWVLLMRNFFVREEERSGILVLCSGIPPAWLDQEERLFMGPIHTSFGKISVTIETGPIPRVSWEANWHEPPSRIEVRMPGYPYTGLLGAGLIAAILVTTWWVEGMRITLEAGLPWL